MKNLQIKYLVLTALTLFLFSCGAHEEKRHEEKKGQAKTVELTEIQLLQPEKTVVIPGELMPWESVSIYSKVKGFIKEMNVDRGSLVHKGDVLVVIEAPEFKAELAKQHASIEENRAKFIASRATYKRLLQTSKTAGAVSPNELDIAMSRMNADSSNMVSAQAAYQQMHEIVNYLVIKAPFDGIIKERNVHPGALVGPEDGKEGHPPLLVLDNESKLRVTVAVPEIYSSEIEKKCNIKFKVSAFPEKVFTACLGRESGSLNENIRSVLIEFDYINKNHDLKPGMYADVSIPIQRTTPTLYVPSSAVVSSTERAFVIKVDKGGIAEWVDVKKGNVVDSLTEIFGQVQKGEKIVVKASEEIRQGDTLSIKDSKNFAKAE